MGVSSRRHQEDHALFIGLKSKMPQSAAVRQHKAIEIVLILSELVHMHHRKSPVAEQSESGVQSHLLGLFHRVRKIQQHLLNAFRLINQLPHPRFNAPHRFLRILLEQFGLFNLAIDPVADRMLDIDSGSRLQHFIGAA